MTGENEIEQEKSGQTRLEAFEKMLSAVQQNYQNTLDKMEQLKNLFSFIKTCTARVGSACHFQCAMVP